MEEHQILPHSSDCPQYFFEAPASLNGTGPICVPTRRLNMSKMAPYILQRNTLVCSFTHSTPTETCARTQGVFHVRGEFVETALDCSSFVSPQRMRGLRVLSYNSAEWWLFEVDNTPVLDSSELQCQLQNGDTLLVFRAPEFPCSARRDFTGADISGWDVAILQEKFEPALKAWEFAGRFRP